MTIATMVISEASIGSCFLHAKFLCTLEIIIRRSLLFAVCVIFYLFGVIFMLIISEVALINSVKLPVNIESTEQRLSERKYHT